jgi:hypothetical protein
MKGTYLSSLLESGGVSSGGVRRVDAEEATTRLVMSYGDGGGGQRASLTRELASMAYCSGMSMLLWLWSRMYNCSKGSNCQLLV